MSDDVPPTDRDHNWHPDQLTDYADGPILTHRQAETIAALDSYSRQSAAALLGISASTVDDHRQDGQARVIAAIRQLQQLLAHSATVRAAVEDAFGAGEISLGSADHPEDASFPNLSTDELVAEASLPETPDTHHISPNAVQSRRHASRQWKAAFVDEYGDAERVEVIDPTTSERVDVGSLIEFPLETATIPVGELREADLLDQCLSALHQVLSSMEASLVARRID